VAAEFDKLMRAQFFVEKAAYILPIISASLHIALVSLIDVIFSGASQDKRRQQRTGPHSMIKCEPGQVYYAAAYPRPSWFSSHVLIRSQPQRLQYMRTANHREPKIHSGSIRADISRAYEQKHPLVRLLSAG
jgi:hypothetical protein